MVRRCRTSPVRHSHPRVAKDPEPPPLPTGIDYLALIEARHSEEMAKRIVYTDLPDGAGPSEETWTASSSPARRAGTSSPTGPSKTERASHEHRAASRPLRLFEECPSERTSPPERCIATPATWRPSPGSGSSSRSRGGGANRRSRLRQDRGSSGRGRRTRFVAPYVVYLANPTIGVRGMHAAIVSRSEGSPVPRRGARPPDGRPPRAGVRRAGEEGDPRGRRGSPSLPEQLEGLRLLMNAELDSVSPFSLAALRQPTLARRIRLGAFGRLGAADRSCAITCGHERFGDRRVHRASPGAPGDGATGCLRRRQLAIHQVSRACPAR